MMFPAERGQIRTLEEEQYSVGISATGLSLTDFASPKLNLIREELYKEKARSLRSLGLPKRNYNWANDLAEENKKAAQLKLDKIEEARQRVKNHIYVG